MRAAVLCLVAVGILSPAGSAAPLQGRWTTHPLRTLGGHFSGANAINAKGQIAGWSQTAGGAKHATLWTNAKPHDLGTLGGGESEAVAVNDAGDVVGTSRTSSGAVHAFYWHGGHMTDLGTHSSLDSAPVAINDSGQVLVEVGVNNSAFVWRNGHATQLGALSKRGQTQATDLNDKGQIVGSSFTTGGKQRAFVWQSGHMKDLGTLGGPWSLATAINDHGTVVGSSQLDTGFWRGAIWKKGRPTNLGRGVRAYRDRATAALAINGQGTVAGFCVAIDFAPRPCLWRNGTTVALGGRSQRGQLTAINAAGEAIGYHHGISIVAEDGTLSPLAGFGKHACVQANGINDNGLIVGSSTGPDCESASRAVEWIPS